MPIAAPIIGAVASSVVGKAMGGGSDSGGSQATDRAPWEPAQPFLKDLIKDGQSLYAKYQQNPFSDTQKTAYQNQFTMNDTFNNQIMPGLLKGFQGLLGPGFGDISSQLSGGLSARNQGLLSSASTPQYSQDQLQGAGQFIQANLDNPALIKQKANEYNLSNADLLRASQTVAPNATMAGVNEYMGRQDPQYAKPSFGLLDFSQYSRMPTAQATALANETPAQRAAREEQEYLLWLARQAAGGGSGGGVGNSATGGGSPGDADGVGDSTGE